MPRGAASWLEKMAGGRIGFGVGIGVALSFDTSTNKAYANI